MIPNIAAEINRIVNEPDAVIRKFQLMKAFGHLLPANAKEMSAGEIAAFLLWAAFETGDCPACGWKDAVFVPVPATPADDGPRANAICVACSAVFLLDTKGGRAWRIEKPA